jgi:hypothetical protein
MGLTGYRYRVLRERANVDLGPVDFESPTRLREGRPINIDREAWLTRKIDLEKAGRNYDGLCGSWSPDPMQ